jgi:tRNA A37 threonylcarbamoyladenosine synthetase subunit TsaC/SUA5/YrdC
MGYVAAGYIAVFATMILYSVWAILRSRKAAAQVLAAKQRAERHG